MEKKATDAGIPILHTGLRVDGLQLILVYLYVCVYIYIKLSVSIYVYM